MKANKWIFFVGCLLFSCKVPESKIILTNTKWEYKVADNCTNYYYFKNANSFIFYSCEQQDIFFGNYFQSKDSFLLDDIGSVSDTIFNKNSCHKFERRHYKIIIKNNMMRHIYLEELKNGKWEKSNWKFDKDYIYRKK